MIGAPTTGQVVTEHPLNSYWYAQNYVGAARRNPGQNARGVRM